MNASHAMHTDGPKKVAFLIQGLPGSPADQRTSMLAPVSHPGWRVSRFHRSPRKVVSIAELFLRLMHDRPDLCYVVDMAFSGVFAGALYRSLTESRLVIDTGDAIGALAEAMGRTLVGRVLTRALERFSLASADAIVVRGSEHREWLAPRGVRATLIPDGVDRAQFRPLDVRDLRARLGLNDHITIGILGSIVWNPKTGSCYGWDLVELIYRLRDRPVAGILIGDGSGLELLRGRAHALGIEHRILFFGRRPYDELPRLINLIDVCLSTQTNDLPGRVRTTGKLPLYLACGRYVLASRVGEAARVLPEEMLVAYHGAFDPYYSDRLARRVRELLDDPKRIKLGRIGVTIAERHFDHHVLSERLQELLCEQIRLLHLSSEPN